MSLNTSGARLWFDTQAEIDDYDNLMLANIELKTDDYDDPNFTIIASRKRKEIMPGGHNSLFNRTMARFENWGLGQNHVRLGEQGMGKTHSLLINEDYYLAKSFANWTLGYLVLRELPVRNFYARSLMMTYFALKFFEVWGQPSIFGFTNSHIMHLRTRESHDKERRIFYWFQQTDHQNSEGLNGKAYLFEPVVLALLSLGEEVICQASAI